MTRPARPARPARLARSLVAFLTCTAAVQPVAAQSAKPEVDLSGEVRVRGELDARSAGAGADAATLLRARLGVLATLNPRTRTYVQLSDSRIFGEEANTLTDASADHIDLHQAYLEWEPLDSLRLRIGRQELAFADERLVGSVNWANVTRSFDGLRATLSRRPWTIDVFAATVDERDATLATGLDPRRNQGQDDDRALFGAWATNGPFDLFAIVDRNASEEMLTDIDRYTLGSYARATFGAWSGKATAAVQLGRQTPTDTARQDISAFLVSGAISRRWAGRLRPSLAVQVDVLSGDPTPRDRTYSAFNTLYATNHAFYGYMDLFLNLPQQTAFLGLIDLMLRGAAQAERWRVRLDLHRLQLARSTAAGDRAIGVELDLTAKRPLADGFELQLGYSIFNPEAAASGPRLSLGDEVLHWAYMQGTAKF